MRWQPREKQDNVDEKGRHKISRFLWLPATLREDGGKEPETRWLEEAEILTDSEGGWYYWAKKKS